MKNGIIFDFDGVLVDSLSSLKQVYTRICNKVNETNIEINEESDFIALNGRTIEEISQYIHEYYATSTDVSSIIKLYRKELATMYNDFTIDLMWIEVFSRYKKLGFSLSIASGCDSEYIKMVLNNSSILHLFDLVIGGDLVKKGKPNPEVFLKCIDSLKLNETLIIDDSNNGVLAAILADAKIIKYDNISRINISKLIDKAINSNISYLGQINSLDLDVTDEMSQKFSIEENNHWSSISAYNGHAYFVNLEILISSNRLNVISGSYKNFRVGTTDRPILAVTGLIKRHDNRVLVGTRSRHNYQNTHLLDLTPSGTLSVEDALNQVNEEWFEESSSELVIEWNDSISLILDHDSKVLDLLFLSTGNNFSTELLHSAEIETFEWINIMDNDASNISESAHFMATLLD